MSLKSAVCTTILVVGVNSFLGLGELASADPNIGILPGPATPGGVDPSRDDYLKIPQQNDAIFPIPPVMDRPLDIDEGPRIIVNKIELEGLIERDEYGISKKIVKKLLIKELKKQQKTSLERYEKSTLSIGQIQLIADAVTNFYRDAGLILAQVYLPAQQVFNGTIKLRIIEGNLGQILPENNQSFSYSQLKKPFETIIDQPVTVETLETALLLLNDYPGILASGTFTTGEKPGTTDLRILIQEERFYQGSLQYDNHGSEFTGQLRYQSQIALNNVLGLADTLELRLLKSAEPSNSHYWSAQYQFQLLSPRDYVGASYNKNQFNIGNDLQKINVEGFSTQAELFWKHAWHRSRAFNLYSNLNLAKKHSLSESVEFGYSLGEDKLTILSAELSFDQVDNQWGGVNIGSIKYSKGLPGKLGALPTDIPKNSKLRSSRQNSDFEFVGGQFDKWQLNYARVQSIFDNQTLIFNFKSQYSSDLLLSLEQFSLGGPNNVRAYPGSEFLTDKGYFASLEWNIGLPFLEDKKAFSDKKWGDLLNLSLFTDYAKGRLNDLLKNQQEETELSGVGVGIYLNDLYGVNGRFFIATPISSRKASNGEHTQFYTELTYHF